MSARFSRWKRGVLVALIAVFALDAGLAIERWRMSAASAQQQYQQRALRLRGEVAALRANLKRAEAVRKQMPDTAAQCNRFYNQQLLGSAQGYAALVADLDAIAEQAGLTTSNLRFDRKGSTQHGVSRVDANAVIEGSYDGLIHFIDGLEQSKNFYVLDSLQLGSITGGRVKLNIRLHTYFRT